MAQRRVEKGISQRIQGGTIMNSSDVKKSASFDDIIEQHQLSRDALKALEKRPVSYTHLTLPTNSLV